MIGVVDYIGSPQPRYTVPSEQSLSTYAYCWTAQYVEELLNRLGRDIGSEMAARGLTPEDLQEILDSVREKEFRARYGA